MSDQTTQSKCPKCRRLWSEHVGVTTCVMDMMTGNDALARATAAEARAKRLEEALRDCIEAVEAVRRSGPMCPVCDMRVQHTPECPVGRAEQTARKAMEG